MRDIVILGGTRTAIGSFGGSLAGITPIDLGATEQKPPYQEHKLKASKLGW